jgi:hypothetical protein
MAGLLWAGLGHAQAWLPSAGSADMSLSYVDTWTTKHYLHDGSEVDVGHIRTFIYGLGAEYSPTDKLMFAASLPLVESGYDGKFPHPVPVDHGGYHATFTDLRMEMHYQVALTPFAITPYAAFVQPTHTYASFGHAAPGRDLQETWLGVAVGKTLDQWIPRTFIESRFTYAWVQAVQHISHDKENVEIDLGYFITPYLSVQGFWHWQQTLGGVQLPVPPTNSLYPYHDQLGADGFTAVGFSSAWSFSDQSSFSVTYSTDLMGRNGHKVDSAWAVSYDYQLNKH